MPSPTSLAPGYVRVTYSGTLFPHHMTVPVQYVLSPIPGEEPDLVLKDETTLGAIAAIAAFIAVILPFFKNTTQFGLAEAHTVDAVTGEDQFIYAWDLGVTGSGSAANIPASQTVLTFKSRLGTLYRLYLMEGNQPLNQHALPPYTGVIDDLVEFVKGDSSPIYARGNSFIFGAVSFITKTNDSLRKQQGLA